MLLTKEREYFITKNIEDSFYDSICLFLNKKNIYYLSNVINKIYSNNLIDYLQYNSLRNCIFKSFYQYLHLYTDTKGNTFKQRYLKQLLLSSIKQLKLSYKILEILAEVDNPKIRNYINANRTNISNSINELIEHNTGLIADIAIKYSKHGYNFNDLYQEGLIGLIKAIEKYDYKKGYKFSTYATWWIRQSINNSLPNIKSLSNTNEVKENTLIDDSSKYSFCNIEKILCSLTPREEKVLRLRFNLNRIANDKEKLIEYIKNVHIRNNHS